MKKETATNRTVSAFIEQYQQNEKSINQNDVLAPYVFALNFLIGEIIPPNPKKPKLIKRKLNSIVKETIKAEKEEYANIGSNQSLLTTLRKAAQDLLVGSKPPKIE